MSSPMTTILQVKTLMNQLTDQLYETSQEAGLDLSREALLTEFKAVGAYVAGADNNISNEEIELINFLFDNSFTPGDMPELIEILSRHYNTFIVQLKLPGWMLCKVMDQAMGSHEVTDLYINVMDLVMKLFAAIDGNTDAREDRFINEFINRMKSDRSRV